MANDVLYSEEAVLKMLRVAYRAGFDGPLDIQEEVCRDIITRNTYRESDIEFMEYMERRKQSKLAEEVKTSINNSRRQNTGGHVPDFFEDEL